MTRRCSFRFRQDSMTQIFHLIDQAGLNGGLFQLCFLVYLFLLGQVRVVSSDLPFTGIT